ncbi:DEAD/DEAH box helicase [Pedobacter sp. SD-b]|uniref:DEAD/DEAH box helicase n=1 Tax=Pedobacter segetis TaxID=2793069 RepID=A0ABS1BNK2_9SPHI|nr:DEAD/DEAH box helicase [Pedobacter segetis]MBK0384342.1 DEAD/DEAH box helicase [Pedobacter segetis]
MATLEKLKLSKQLLSAMANEGFLTPKEIQSRLFPRINGGENLVAIGPDGCGKTTTCVLAALNKIKFIEEIAPRILYLVPDIETGEAVLDTFHTLNRNRDLRIMGLFADGASIDAQVLELTDGVDVIVATPDRARAAYLKLGLNLNKILFFVVDDAELIVKKGLTLPTVELARGIRKSQFIVCSSVWHERLQKMVETILENPNFVEVEDLGDQQLNTVEQLLYQVPNFGTKISLIQLLLTDKEVFEKVLVFVNTRFTAETIFKNLDKDFNGEVAVYKAGGITEYSFDDTQDFKLSPKFRVLVIANEDVLEVQVSDFPCLIHLDIPKDALTYLQRMLIKENTQTDQLCLTFCTDLELADIKRLEQKQGKKMQQMQLPDDLYIVKEKTKKKAFKEEG